MKKPLEILPNIVGLQIDRPRWEPPSKLKTAGWNYLKRVDEDLRNGLLADWCVYYPVLKHTYLAKISYVTETGKVVSPLPIIDEGLERFKQARLKRAAAYANELANAGLLKEANETEESIIAKFNVEWLYVSLVPPQLPGALGKSELLKAEAMWQTIFEKIRSDQRMKFNERILVVVHKLGYPALIRFGLWDNILRFAQEFRARNITEDDEFAAIVRKTENILTTAPLPDEMRHSPADAAALREKLQAISDEIKGLPD